MRFAEIVPPGTSVLDVACGHGRHARFFATRGHDVIAADIDTSGVTDLSNTPRVAIDERDLETGDWPYPKAAFGAIVVANYLHRPHFDHYASSLSPGGVLLIDTFGEGNELLGRPRNPAFLLKPGELIAAFGSQLEIVAYECGSEQHPRSAVRQRLCAVRGHSPPPTPWQLGLIR